MCGCERVLTSGQSSTAPQAGKLLGDLVRQAAERISIMPGAGMNSHNLSKLIEESKATEYHASARRIAENPVTFINRNVSDYGNVYIADESEVRAMVQILNTY
jgi:copper homeostasis protein